MRLSITIAPDLHQIAAGRLRARNVSLSRETNTLLRTAVSPPAAAPSDTATLITYEGRVRFPVSRGLPPLHDEDDFRRLNP